MNPVTIESVLYWAAAIIAIGGAITVVWKVIRPVIKKTRSLIQSLDKFTEDWFGTPAAPGRDPVPGVMERLNNIDGELKHNGGSTMKDSLRRMEESGKDRDDVLCRIEERLTSIDHRLDEGNTKFDEVEHRLTEMEESSYRDQ